MIVLDSMHAFSMRSHEIVLNSKQTVNKCDCVVGSFKFWWSGQYLFGILTIDCNCAAEHIYFSYLFWTFIIIMRRIIIG